MHSSHKITTCGPHSGALNLSVRQRLLFHRLLYRDLGKCSASALGAFERSGWVLGVAGGYELTARGRRVAELSEQAPAEQSLEL